MTKEIKAKMYCTRPVGGKVRQGEARRGEARRGEVR